MAGVSRPSQKDSAVKLYILALLGALIVALNLAAPLALRAYDDTGYIVVAIAAGIVVVGATAVAKRIPDVKAMWLIVSIAVILRLILLFTPPLLSDDIYRYVWDGMVQAQGINPYRYVPADQNLAFLRDAEIYPHINRANYAVTAYPPVAQMFFFLVTRFGETVTVMKTALLICECVTATIILLLLAKLRRPLTLFVAYAWHPLPLWQIANSGHIDALMMALMMLGIWLALMQKPVRGAAIVMLSALAKPFSVLSLPPLWRPWDWKLPLACIAVVVICYVPYLSVGRGVLGFLTSGYLNEEGYDTGSRIWLLAAFRSLIGTLPGDFIFYYAIAALILLLLAVRAAFRKMRSVETIIEDISKLLMAGLLLLSPNYPWYYLIVTPFVPLQGGTPTWVMTIGAILLHEEVFGATYIPLMVRKSFFYGLMLLALAFAAGRYYLEYRRKFAHE